MDVNEGSFARPSLWRTSHSLAAAVAEAITIPATPPNVFRSVRICAEVDLYWRVDGVAVAAAADVVDGTASGYIPAKQARNISLVPDGDGKTVPTPYITLSLISTPGGIATCEWYR